MRQAGIFLALFVLAAAVSGCDVQGVGSPVISPYPALPAQIPADMAEAIAAAQPYVAEYSSTAPSLRTAYALDVAEACEWPEGSGPNDVGPCPGRTGTGWGVVFDITRPGGQPSELLVVLDANADLLYLSSGF